MGHGGTLDPLATGVLIVGIGRGTKQLIDYQVGSTKTYETVVLFGKSTDTYDVAGKIVADAPYEHISRALVEEKLPRFRGKIKQVPPIYSALKINGMKAYEYARSGEELPRELESRDMEVSECEFLEWYEGGKHEYRWPAQDASPEDKVAVSKFLKVTDNTLPQRIDEETTAKSNDPSSAQIEAEVQPPSSPPKPPPSITSNLDDTAQKAAQHTHALGPLSTSPSPAPAARIRLTVSSGFYVRSFAHDLGLACNSLGIMTSLIRTRQGDYVLPGPQASSESSTTSIEAIKYADLEAGEEQGWGPKLSAILTDWVSTQPAPASGRESSSGYTRTGKYSGKARRDDSREWRKRRRNSSSPDE